MRLRTRAVIAVPLATLSLLTSPARQAFAQVGGSPNSAGMPGAALITQIISWLMWGGLMARLGAFVHGAALRRGGAKVGNGWRAEDGRQYVAGGAIGALLIGLAVTAINTFFSAGQAG